MPCWRHLVAQHARRAGADLPPATVEELALHLEDIHAAVLEEGGSVVEARARTMQALEESTLSVLRRHARRSQRPHAREADDTARAAEERSLHVSSAIRTALRQFRHHPGFAAVVVLVLGIGTAAAATVFSVVDSVVLRPLPYRLPDRLVTLWDTNSEKGLAHDPISPVNFMDYRALPVFESAAAWWRPSLNLIDPGLDPVRVNAIETSGNLFEVLGVGPQVGAGFPVGGPLFVRNQPTIVISHRLWRTRYSADPSIVGRQLNLDGTAHTVAGVMPAGFHYPDDIDVWQLLRWDLTEHSRAAHFMEAVARLAEGATLWQAQSAVDALGLRLQEQFASTNRGWGTRLIPLLDEQLGYYRPALMVLFGAVALLLLIGCLNVASLLLTRALSREREMAVRIAVGASPRQLVAQLFAESLVLSAAGAALGIAAAAMLLPILVNIMPVSIPRLEEAGVNLRALGFGLMVLVATTTFFGLLPALLFLKRQVTTELKTGERGSSRGPRRIYSILVAGEVALACALLVSSTLLVRTVNRMTSTPTGVDADDVLTASVQLPNGAYNRWRIVSDTHAAIIDQIRRHPGVVAAGGGNFLPLEVGWRVPFGMLGEPGPARPEEAPQAQIHSVSEGYFESLGVSMASGRSFTNLDTPDATPVVVVNERFVRQYLAKGPAVGQVLLITATNIGPLGANLFRLRPPRPAGTPPPPPLPPTRFEIVGIVRDVRNAPLGQEVEPAIYFTTRQFPFQELFLTIRAVDRASALSALQRGLEAAAPGVPYGTPQTWGGRFAKRTAEPRLLMTVLTAFAALAALLAALGIYGLFSWSVALRQRELAIRLTLGASPASVGRLVLGQSVLLIAAGLVAGILLIRGAEGALASVVFEVSPTDPGAAAIASGLLLVAALAACIPPALRAMRVDPVEGLRAE
ncbi:MAG TPA: ABC transporter permease [Vicinamibacterales bacterium]|nr:ABC transporter permease [Vicinamibacterales bacterium]